MIARKDITKINYFRFRSRRAPLDREEQQGRAERAEEGGNEASPETGGQRLQLRPEDCQVQGPGQTRKAGKEESQAGCRSGSKR